MRKIFWLPIVAVGLGLAAMAYSAPTTRSEQTADTYHMLELFGDAMARVKSEYVAEPEDKKLVEAAIDGMLASLDPHSSYLTADDFRDMQVQTKGEYGGLGLEVSMEDGAVKVVSPIDGTPAARAGLKAGDYISALDGKSIVGITLNEAVKQMRGPVGTKVTLTIVRQGKDEPFDVDLTREIVAVKSITHRMEKDGIGYVRVSAFNERTTEGLEAAIKAIKRENPKLKGFVLDLRNNPGGLLDQAVGVADVFLDGGEVVSQRGRNPEDIERYNARPGDLLAGVPVVVLINGGSASASEVVAGALQDRKRATVLGTTSFGKGSVQTIIPLRGGRDGALRLTTARYYAPSGRSIQATGIDPDVEIAQSRKEAEYLSKKGNLSEASLPNALSAQDGKKRSEPHAVADQPPVGYDEEKGDYQLDRALEFLRKGGVLTASAPAKKPA